MDKIIFIYPVLIVALSAASFTDIQGGRIPNFITVPLMVAGLSFHTAVRGIDGLAFSAKGLGVGFGLLVLLYAVGGFGAGDVKLVAGTGSVLGPSAIVSALFAATLLAGLCAIVLLGVRLGLSGSVKWLYSFLKMLLLLGGKPPSLPSDEKRVVLRYAPVFAVGTLASLVLFAVE